MSDSDLPFEFTGIGGIFFRSDDTKGIQQWYVDNMGLKPDEHGYIVIPWAQRDGSPATTTWAPFKRDTAYFGDSDQKFMINYRVTNLDAALASLRAKGIWVDDNTEDGEYGKFGWARDGEGTRFEIWEPPDGM